MRSLIVILLLIPLLVTADEKTLIDDLSRTTDMVTRLERLSKERKYGEIFDSLASDYRRNVDREFWISTSTRLGWVITKPRMGTFSQNGDFADAPVESETLIGKKVLGVHAVAYFVREDGEWRLWNFPFVPSDLPDRLYWPPPFNGPNQPPQTTPVSAPR